ncbi:zinc-dependent alcohol dehydrogenase [Pseudonocardia nigra]|uniref:zinc-dependent alcohol dehydrogenase n=1 Tax=Pseudonocardia nigra TaxID=1921578 RepID=UPI001C5DBDFF|nr:alcohol dehydrogenase catalytic domain-containing protein [Pseudonocardia nigra]
MIDIPTTMRRVVVTADGVVVETAPVPQPGAGEALVEMHVAGVCGSDTHASHGRHPFLPLPYRPGHEVVGTVRSVGTGVSGPSVGARVTAEPTLPCWTCKMCTTGRSNLCENLRFFGCGDDQGGMAGYFTIPADRLHVVPDGLDDLQAALIEPLATPVHATRLAGGLTGKAVAILGAGTIGLLLLAAVRHRGARRVVVTDVLPSKRERALRLGADAVVDPTRPDAVGQVRAALGESADVVFDCVAVQTTVDQAIAIALKAGTVVVVGVAARDVTVPLPLVQDQQVRIQGSATYLPEDYRDAIEILISGAIRTEDYVTATLPLDHAAEAFALSAAGEQVKVVLTA